MLPRSNRSSASFHVTVLLRAAGTLFGGEGCFSKCRRYRVVGVGLCVCAVDGYGISCVDADFSFQEWGRPRVREGEKMSCQFTRSWETQLVGSAVKLVDAS
jgi:hypothetical protein